MTRGDGEAEERRVSVLQELWFGGAISQRWEPKPSMVRRSGHRVKGMRQRVVVDEEQSMKIIVDAIR